MTTGAFNLNGTDTYPSGFRGSPWYRKEWSGANDPLKKAFNAYSMLKVVCNHRQISQSNPYYPYDPPTYYASRGMPDWSLLVAERDSFDGSTALRAQAKCLEAVRNHDFYAGEALAEVDESLKAVLSSLRNLTKTMVALSKRDYQGVIRGVNAAITSTPPKKRRTGQQGGSEFKKELRTGDMASVWLSFQFGWLPLVSSVYAALDALDGRHEKLRSSVFTGRASAPPRSKQFAVNPAGNSAIGSIKEEYTVRVLVYSSVDPWTLAGFSKQAWASVVWERIPFSFIFDYFLPVGAMLQNWAELSNVAKALQVTRFKSMHGETRPTYNRFDLPPTHSQNTSWKTGWSNWDAVSLVRTIDPADTIILPSIKPIHKIASTGHLLNTAALVFGMLGDSKFQFARYAVSSGLLTTAASMAAFRN